MSSFPTLPIEIWNEIIQLVTSIADLKNIRLCCKSFDNLSKNNLFNSYRSVIRTADDIEKCRAIPVKHLYVSKGILIC